MREDAGLTGVALATQLGWPGSKVSKIEHGRQTPTVDDVHAWVTATRGSDEILTDLVADLRVLRMEYRTWARLLRRGLGARQRAVVPLDAATTTLRAFEPAVVPGLLQTAHYAKHVLAGVVAFRSLPGDVDAGVAARLDRQSVLYEPSKQFKFLVTEAALRYLVCPPQVLRGQLDRLLAVIGLDNVEVAVLGFDTPLPYPAVHGFWLYDDRLVLVDTISAELVLRDADDVTLYRQAFDLLWEVAHKGEDARERISAVSRAIHP